MVKFTLNQRAFSVNAYHYRDKRHKTAEARAWEAAVTAELNEVKELSAIAEDWKAHGGYFVLHLTVYYPHHVFYTAHGEISSKTFDCSNVEKPLQDLIFKQMGLNDKLVKKLISEKSSGAYGRIEVKLELHPNA